jgi:hypothetical protein
MWEAGCRELTESEHSLRDFSPFAPLPIQTLDGYHGLSSENPWNQTEERRPQCLVMDDVIIEKEKVYCG